MLDDITIQAIPVETVAEIVGLSQTTIYQKTRKGEFPQARKLGGSTRWLKHEVVNWLLSRPVAAGNPNCTLATKGNRVGPPRGPRSRPSGQ